ncbi:MAG: hypothetical protein ABFR32_01610 [Bacteroidota bacterium]
MHLKIIPSFLMLFVCTITFPQEATEIYLFELNKTDHNYTLTNPINISDNEGYDNQPSFTDDGTSILFSSNRNGQTDIALYDIEFGFRSWLTNTEGNEFSPASIPKKKKYFSCIRLNEDGSQLLYKYSYKNKEPLVLIPNLKVGYYIWFDNKSVILFVLGDLESLQVNNFKYKIRYPAQQKIGRSFQKIPDTDLISFISKSHETPEIYSLNPINSETTFITDPIEGSEDLTWTLDGSILMAKDAKIFKFKPHEDKDWKEITIESDLPLKNITRLVVSPDGTKIAIVVDE